MSVDAADAAWADAEADAAEQARAAAEIAAEIAASRTAVEHHAAARRVHIRAEPTGRLDDVTGPHPRGLHVACPACARLAGFGCEHPSRPTPVGFVHPSRLDAEAAWWAGIANTTATE